MPKTRDFMIIFPIILPQHTNHTQKRIISVSTTTMPKTSHLHIFIAIRRSTSCGTDAVNCKRRSIFSCGQLISPNIHLATLHNFIMPNTSACTPGRYHKTLNFCSQLTHQLSMYRSTMLKIDVFFRHFPNTPTPPAPPQCPNICNF